jgi:PKD repeat protein
VWNSVVAAVVVLLLVPVAVAQKHPLPKSTANPPVICTGCPGTNLHGQSNDGLPTASFALPIAAHVGRTVDSSSTADYQHIGFRTARARMIRIAPSRGGSAPPRVYIGIGEAVAAYSLSKFFSTTLPGGTVAVNTLTTGSTITGVNRNPLERIAPLDAFIYPEAKSLTNDISGWTLEFGDGQQRLGDFDFDDRGYIYAAYINFGWGIVKDSGETGGGHFPHPVKQIKDDSSGVTPRIILTIKTGGRYYAIVSAEGSRSLAVYDVTNPASPGPPVVRNGSQWGIRAWAKEESSGRVAIIDYDWGVSIYSDAAFVSGGTPIVTYKPATAKAFGAIDFDDSGNLWMAESAKDGVTLGQNALYRATPTGGTYTVQTFNPYGPGNFTPSHYHGIDAAAGFVVVGGRGDRDGSAALEARILKIENGTPRLLDDGNFFRRYYHSSLPGMAMSQTLPQYTTLHRGLKIFKHGTKTYLFYHVHGMGDVYELQGSDSVGVTMKTSSFGTVNPYSKPTQPGPFIGDRVAFTATSSTPGANFRLLWDFGNPEAGILNLANSDLGEEVLHQYTGLNTAAKVTAPRQVKATSTTDSDVSGSLALTLKLPAARVGATGSATPLSATASIDVVAGDFFNDASDGSVESHFATWTIDGIPTAALPNVEVPVGAIGPHTLSFKASYGTYDTTSLSGNALYEVGINSISYTVRPFMVSLKPPVKSGTNIVFSADGRKTSDTSILSATQWTVTWTVNGVAQPVQTANVGTVPSLTLPQSSIGSGTIIGVEVAVDPAGLGEIAANYASHSASTTLSPPDPVIEVSGCTNVGSPCTVTAKSASSANMSDWTYLWTIRNSAGTTVQTGTAASLALSIVSSGTYTVNLTATKSVFDVAAPQRTVTLAAPLCGPPPPQSSLAISASCTSNCPVGQPIHFSASVFGASLQSCDVVTWTFGDNSASKSGSDVSHTYSGSGTFTVRMTISNSSGSPSVSATQTVSVGTGTTCTPPSSITITYSGNKGCGPGVACKTDEAVTFIARKSGANLQTCDLTSWNFGNGVTSTTKTPTYTYNSTGNFTVSVSVSNTLGTAQGSTGVAVVPDTTTCSGSPATSNLTIAYYGQTSGCSGTNSVLCKANETIEFYASSFGYSFQSCDRFEWNFGDGSPLKSDKDPTHIFPGTATSFNVRMRVYNSTNMTGATVSQNVAFEASVPVQPIPILTYTGFPTRGTKGMAVNFRADSNIDDTTGWVWDFGDGTAPNTSQSAVVGKTSTIAHTFASTGTYVVTASARNSKDAVTAPKGLVTASITIDETPEYRYLLVAGHISGQNNTAWRTDVQIYNPDPNVSATNPLRLTADFRGTQKTLEIANSTHIYQDFMSELVSGDANGPVIITARTQQAPQIWTRTYNQTESGTFGQFIPAIRLDAGGGGAIGEGKYYLAGLRQDNRFRTNLGFVNPTSQAITAIVSVFDDSRFQVGQFNVQLPPFQMDQFPVTSPKGVPTLSPNRPFSLEVEVPQGQWLVAYASFIDNQSDDPVFLQAIRESELAHADYRYSVIPGVGHVGDWRSDVTIFNPASQTIAVDLAYHDQTGAKVAGAQNVVIRGGEFVQYTDILRQGVFGGELPDSLGVLRVTVPGTLLTNRFPMTFARTYNDNGSGRTFGQGIAGFAIDRPNVRPGKPALVPGIRSNAGYYTNFGLINVSHVDVVATVKVLDPVSGAESTIFQQTLSPYQSVVGPVNVTGTASLKIESVGGNVWGFASIIDRGTLDPEYVPATPLAP